MCPMTKSPAAAAPNGAGAAGGKSSSPKKRGRGETGGAGAQRPRRSSRSSGGPAGGALAAAHTDEDEEGSGDGDDAPEGDIAEDEENEDDSDDDPPEAPAAAPPAVNFISICIAAMNGGVRNTPKLLAVVWLYCTMYFGTEGKWGPWAPVWLLGQLAAPTGTTAADDAKLTASTSEAFRRDARLNIADKAVEVRFRAASSTRGTALLTQSLLNRRFAFTGADLQTRRGCARAAAGQARRRERGGAPVLAPALRAGRVRV